MRYIITLIAFVSLGKAFAHPVIYKGGTVVSSFNMTSNSINTVMYSWSQRFASGVNHFRFSNDGRNTEMVFAKTNALLFRHNGEKSQSNIYLHAGVGVVDQEIGVKDTGLAWMTGIDADYETRVLYGSLKHYRFPAPGLRELQMTQARIGFSPYEANFEELQSWFMVQAMYLPVADTKISIMPLLRFFYKNVLWEMGSSTRGEWLLNLMVHY